MPSIDDIKVLLITFHMEGSYLNIPLDKITHTVKHLHNIQTFCSKIIPFIYYYKNQVDSYNQMVYDILTKNILLIYFQHLKKNKKEKRGIITLLVTGFIGLALEELSSYLHNKREKALQKAFDAMERKVDLDKNEIFYLEDSMIMYGIYNAQTVDNLVNTLKRMHNKTTWNEKLFVGALLIGLTGIYQNRQHCITL